MRIAGICLLAVLALTVGGMDRELRKIRDRNNAGSIQTVSDSRVRRTLNQQRADGSWPGIDYRHQGRGSWHPAKHLARLRLLAAGYAAPGSEFFRNRELLAAVLRGLDFWAERDPQSPNWWYSEIGTPRQLLDTLLLLGDDLPPEYPEKFRAILDRSRPGMTGQNKVWLAGIHLLKGVLYQRPELVREGREQILSELRLAAPGREGIQADWSFHQHGAQLQFGNYGLAYFTEMVRWLSVLSESVYAFPPDRTVVLQNYYRNGLRWVLFDRQLDFSACGRQNTERLPFQKYRTCVKTAVQLRQVTREGALSEEEEFRFSGCRYFYDSDFLVFRTPEFYCSVKMSSRRIRGSETVNSENLLGRLTGHGATMLMSRRGELEEIGALWDWRKIPGVTAVQDDSSLFCRNPGWDNREEWVGGLSDGEVGFCAMEFDNGELTAKKKLLFSRQRHGVRRQRHSQPDRCAGGHRGGSAAGVGGVETRSAFRNGFQRQFFLEDSLCAGGGNPDRNPRCHRELETGDRRSLRRTGSRENLFSFPRSRPASGERPLRLCRHSSRAFLRCGSVENQLRLHSRDRMPRRGHGDILSAGLGGVSRRHPADGRTALSAAGARRPAVCRRPGAEA